MVAEPPLSGLVKNEFERTHAPDAVHPDCVDKPVRRLEAHDWLSRRLYGDRPPRPQRIDAAALTPSALATIHRVLPRQQSRSYDQTFLPHLADLLRASPAGQTIYDLAAATGRPLHAVASAIRKRGCDHGITIIGKRGRALIYGVATTAAPEPVPTCRVCGCTAADCHQCVEKTGEPCHWVEPDLCSACQTPEQRLVRQIRDQLAAGPLELLQIAVRLRLPVMEIAIVLLRERCVQRIGAGTPSDPYRYQVTP